jgi:hypothetical protein
VTPDLAVEDLSLVPCAMEQTLVVDGDVLEREIPGVGLLRFEDLPAGAWLTLRGEPAKTRRRRYLLDGEELDSVSSIVGLLSKEALYYWHEDHGARGAVQAMMAGELDGVALDQVVKRIRSLGLGAAAVRDEASERGKAIHQAFQTLAVTGQPPRFSDYPEAWAPWVQGCAKAWLKLRPEPIDPYDRERFVEFTVCNPALGYAGRPDLLCWSRGQRTLIDWKTSAKGRIFEQAHWQTRLYAEAFEPCSIEPPGRIVIVAIDDGGNVEIEDCAATAEDCAALVHVFHARERVNAAMAAQRKADRACGARNRAVRT